KRIRAFAFRLDQVNRPRRFVRMTEARTILQKPSLFARSQIRKSRGAGRTSEGEEAIAINSRVTCEGFIQFFASHAFDGITPKAINFSNEAHGLNLILSEAKNGASGTSDMDGKSSARKRRVSLETNGFKLCSQMDTS